MTSRSHSTTIPPFVKIFLRGQRFLLRRSLCSLPKAEFSPDHFDHQPGPPKGDSRHAMRQHRKKRRSFISIVNPTFTGRPPALQKVTKACPCSKCKKGEAIISGRDNQQD